MLISSFNLLMANYFSFNYLCSMSLTLTCTLTLTSDSLMDRFRERVTLLYSSSWSSREHQVLDMRERLWLSFACSLILHTVLSTHSIKRASDSQP